MRSPDDGFFPVGLILGWAYSGLSSETHGGPAAGLVSRKHSPVTRVRCADDVASSLCRVDMVNRASDKHGMCEFKKQT
jgi:hypothetical protein